MLRKYCLTIGIILVAYSSVLAQAFRKGSFSISISEGSTLANYRTEDRSSINPVLVANCIEPGTRDPLIIQYGVSDRWSIGLSSGGDIFNINPSTYYGFSTSQNKVKLQTSELTFDVHYHVFVNKRLDLSVFASSGLFSLKIQGNDQDNFYKHTSTGTIVRYGTKAYYYFYKRFGAVGIISSYWANGSSKDVKDNTEAKNYSTTISGMAIEAGLCYRLFR